MNQDKSARFEFLEYELDRRLRQEEIESKFYEKNLKNLDKEIDYIIQVKEGYKFELGVFLKEIIEGSLDAEYYTKSVIEYRVLMRSINLINYDFED